MDELILVDPWGLDKLILVKLMPKFKFNHDDYLLSGSYKIKYQNSQIYSMRILCQIDDRSF